jgi:hypothetical protein
MVALRPLPGGLWVDAHGFDLRAFLNLACIERGSDVDQINAR